LSIHVQNLSKHYRAYRRETGLRNSFKALFNRTYETIRAVNDISFDVQQGEIVGFLGANGAGKTTTLKCLAGLLYSTSGTVSVLDQVPYHRAAGYLKQITLVMSNRNQLMWDLPVMETFIVNQVIYDIPESMFRATLNELTELLALKPLLTKQVRKLSLGERMKCELAASLLHNPKVMFLDEPTLGLDVTAQVAVRDFIREYNQRHNATVILTSHYMADVTALAKRIIVINQGSLIYDGELQTLVERTAPYKLLKLTLQNSVSAEALQEIGEVESQDGLVVVLRIGRESIKAVAGRALSDLPVVDVTIEEPALDSVIRQVIHNG